MALVLDPEESAGRVGQRSSTRCRTGRIVRFDAERGHDRLTPEQGRRPCQHDRRSAGDRGDLHRLELVQAASNRRATRSDNAEPVRVIVSPRRNLKSQTS